MRVAKFFGLLLAVQAAAWAQTNAHQVRPMSLEDCLEIALQHNLDIKIRRYNPDIARYTLSASFGSYDPSFFASGEHDYSKSPGGVDPQGRTYFGNETESDSFRTGLQGLLPWGLTYNLGGNISDTYGTRPGFTRDLNQPIVITNSFLDVNSGNTLSFLSTNYTSISIREPFENSSGTAGFLQLRQPLLKNFWIDSTRLQIFLNRQNLKISELELRDQLMRSITDVEQAYYNLIFAQENVRVQQKAVEWAERQFAENRKRVEVGAMAPLEEKQAQAEAFGRRADLLASQGTEDTQQRVLKNLLSDDYSKWKDISIRPTAALVAVPETFDLQEGWRRGLRDRADLAQQRVNLEKQGTVVRYQRNQVFPQLDLVGTYGYNAGAREFSGALDQIGRGDNPFYSYGAQLTVPLMQTAARNNYRAAKATRDQIDLQLRQLEQTIMIEIENSIAVANTSFERVQATREARVYWEAAVSAEEKKLESGKSTSFEVLQRQRDLTSARSAEIRALADYNIALASIAYNEGATLERRHVSLELH